MPEFKVTVHIMRKPACLKPEEPVVLRGLHDLGFKAVKGILIGACQIITIGADDEDGARQTATDACNKLLANLVTDKFDIVQVVRV